MRALGFCVSVAHAEYMAAGFTRAGIDSRAVSGRSGSEERAAALRALARGELRCLFAVDLFNEGLDVPAIDTVLFLRPTESATIFLQQLGRGLRRTDGKACLTVLDFIGQQHRQFRFDRRFRALLGGGSRSELTRAVEDGFPYLPSGCVVQLDRVAEKVVLDNIRTTVGGRWADLVAELRGLGNVTMSDFLGETGRDLADLYRSDRGWAALRRDAGLARPSGDHDARLGRAIGRMLHLDDPERLDAYRRILAQSGPPSGEGLDPRTERLLTMLHFDLWGTGERELGLQDGLVRLWDHPERRLEIVELLDVLDAQAEVLPRPLRLPLPIPLAVHCHYTRDEVLAAIGASRAERPRPSREGVFWDEASNCDIFFVTLTKDERHYSPTTMYRDYAISRRLFHWESQSTTTERSPTGRRYVRQRDRGGQVLLFLRPTRGHRAYTFAGTAAYVSHQGERPMAITWRLDEPLTEELYASARVSAA
jgi:hypothetical protein